LPFLPIGHGHAALHATRPFGHIFSVPWQARNLQSSPTPPTKLQSSTHAEPPRQPALQGGAAQRKVHLLAAVHVHCCVAAHSPSHVAPFLQDTLHACVPLPGSGQAKTHSAPSQVKLPLLHAPVHRLIDSQLALHGGAAQSSSHAQPVLQVQRVPQSSLQHWP
jgi:hypothetical protein